MNIIEKLNAAQLKKDIPNFKIGDVIKVYVKIVEGGKERAQVFSGTVIARSGSGINTAITVRRISFGEGVERVFQVHSPRIEKIEISRAGDVRRAKLYYIREKIGKGSKIKEKKKIVIEGEESIAAAQAERAAAAAQPVEQPKTEAKAEAKKETPKEK